MLICSSSPRKEWDFYVFAPNGQRFRSTVEITKYVENNPNVECDLEVTNTFRPENFQKSSIPSKKYNVIYVNPDAKKLKCSLCGILFGTPQNLKRHVCGIIRKDNQNSTNQSNVSSKGQMISE